jgi:hypothetical protein
MKRNRVNVLTVVNSASNITTETIDGKPHIVVRGITPVVDDIVMNRKLYPAAEIEKAYNTLERNPMPLPPEGGRQACVCARCPGGE